MPGFLGAGVSAAYHLVTVIAVFLSPLLGGLATATAIVMFTIGVRLLLAPLSYAAFRGQARQARLLPQVQDLRRKHARQPEELQRALTALYQQEGGLLAGCLPVLAQLPFLSVMYQLFRSKTVGGQPNGLLGNTMLGAQLGSHWLSGAGPFSGQGLVFLGLFALMAATAWVTTRLARGGTAGAQPAGTQAASQASARLTRVLPYLTAVIAAFLPLAAGLYLLTTTAWTLAERSLFRRWSLTRPKQA